MKRTNLLRVGLMLVVMFCYIQCSEPAKVRVACIGDSISEGDWLKNPLQECYPSVLRAELKDGYQVLNFGRSGATMLRQGNRPYWNLSDFGNVLAYEPDIVVIKLGTNDAKPYNIPAHPGEFERDVRAMVDTLAALPSKPRILLCTPVPSFYINFDINDTITVNEVLPAIRKVAAETKNKRVELVDLYSAFKDKKDLFSDGVHPNKEGAKQLASTIASAITGKEK